MTHSATKYSHPSHHVQHATTQPEQTKGINLGYTKADWVRFNIFRSNLQQENHYLCLHHYYSTQMSFSEGVYPAIGAFTNQQTPVDMDLHPMLTLRMIYTKKC